RVYDDLAVLAHGPGHRAGRGTLDQLHAVDGPGVVPLSRGAGGVGIDQEDGLAALGRGHSCQVDRGGRLAHPALDVAHHNVHVARPSPVLTPVSRSALRYRTRSGPLTVPVRSTRTVGRRNN